MVLPEGEKDLREELLVPCKVKGNFRLKGIRTTNPVAVGDIVDYEMNNEGFAFINTIHQRRNYIIRKSINLSKQAHILATNLDQVLLIVTVAHPETSTTFIDRFLATAEAYQVPAVLVINKVDLLQESEDLLHYAESLKYLYYNNIGYEVIMTSVKTGEGLDTLKSMLSGKTTLLAGNSGVGKSSLINQLVPEVETKVADLSEAHDSGQHTTTFSEMFQVKDLGNDTYIIDTPGVRGFGTIEFERESVGHYFREIFRISADCKFGNCTHTHEPGCAVRAAVEESRIAQSRYDSYISILDDETEGKYRT